jgi:hypothetical protein
MYREGHGFVQWLVPESSQLAFVMILNVIIPIIEE